MKVDIEVDKLTVEDAPSRTKAKRRASFQLFETGKLGVLKSDKLFKSTLRTLCCTTTRPTPVQAE